MKFKKLIQKLGFSPKENTSGIFQKKYTQFDNYTIEIDFEKEIFLFGDKITSESKTTQNFSQAENWVVVECVNRLLEKGYKPQNITLEKTWKTGHGTSGRLDILVTRDDGSAYLMIECKTWGTEFEKEYKNLEKNGGQLFTYFQQDKDTDVIMLYASELDGKEIKYRNEIVKIEDDYRQAGNVKDFFERWNKLPKSNGVFDNWASAYEFQSKALTKNDLKVLKQEDSSFIFNRFLEILRHNVVSDKPNAFNKIFTLFLCKIVDENRNEDEQLHFQWLEGEDNHISFQKRLTDLYNRGMLELLEKKVTDVSDTEFDKQFQQVEDQYKDKFKEILTEIRLKKNNEFAIKEVYDDASFEENAKVVKEVVELLQVYKIRYNYRQQFLSDFFELLLTTGLKQESGQFFTPVPIARFIIKSLPFQEITSKKITKGNKNDLLPTVMDYAAGSGHFLTESMEEVQKYIDSLDESKFNPTTKRAIKKWKEDQFDWAEDYVYGIEKDYRLVKTAKVSCYLHGDGLAKVIHGDGLADFSTATEYKDLLKETDKTYPQDNKQFDIIISNPPYSVSAFKGLMDEGKSQKGFDLYDRLTDQSSEIECLFIERTKQLLKDGGVAGIILPSSILSNTGIYAQTREIILKYFDVLAIAELGSNTFMATGTNTVTLFLRRRNNADAFNVEEAVKKLFINLQDVTINGIEKPLQKYIAHVWEGISFEDYKTLLQKSPNEMLKKHEIYQEYDKKIKAKNEQEKWRNILVLEQDKLLYFILALPQKVVLIKTGEKNKEKQFLGYEFSNRRGSEGIHPIKRSDSIDNCTRLYDANVFDNPNKASTYIYKAFQNETDLEIPENLKENISYQNLVEMLVFDKIDFEKNISLSFKIKIKIESKWQLVKLEEIIELISGQSPQSEFYNENEKGLPFYQGKTEFGDIYLKDPVVWTEKITKESVKGDILMTVRAPVGPVNINPFDKICIGRGLNALRVSNRISNIYLFNFLRENQDYIVGNEGAIFQSISRNQILSLKIPLPPLDIQKKIVSEIEKAEKKELNNIQEIDILKKKILEIIQNLNSNSKSSLGVVAENWDNKRKPVTKGDRTKGKYPYYGASGIVDYVSDYLIDDTVLLISEDGANLKSRVYPIAFTAVGKIWVNNHAHILKFKNKATHKLVELIINQMDISEYITGQAQPKLNQKNLNNIKIPLPTIQEQEKIVLEIEKLEGKIKNLENINAKVPLQKKDILKKYL